MNQYTIMTKLGQGAFSVVYRVKRKEDGKEYAMKKIRITTLSSKQISNCLNEVRILASINNPFILAYKDSFFDELTNTFCIVTECLEGGDLFQLINKHKISKKLIDQNTIWRVAMQSLKGLATLHQMNVLHRDIKSANIFMSKDQSQIKLADMNVSIVTANGMAKTQTGTPYYASPEVWMQKPYSAKCDIWSLGCVLYEMASLRPPFVSPDFKSLKKSIISGIYKRIPIQYSTDLQNLIRLCLKVDFKQRLSASELLQCEIMKKRCQSMRQCLTDSLCSNSANSHKLLDRIHLASRRDFKNIRSRLPKNRFEQHSVDKISENRSYCDDRNKQNLINCSNVNKQSSKEGLPALKKSSSVSNRDEQKIKYKDERLISCEERPPLPKKPIRA